MPPKKKPNDKDAKGKKRKGPPPLIPPPEAEVVSDTTKEFFILQIRELANIIQKYEKLRSELELTNTDLRSRLAYLTEKKLNSVVALETQLVNTAQEIVELRSQIAKIRQEMDDEMEDFNRKLLAIQTEHKETEAELLVENQIIQDQIDSLEQFKKDREGLLDRVFELEQALFDQDAEHKHNVYLLDRKQVQSHDRLKKEMMARIKVHALEFHVACNQSMAETTKRTLQENLSITFQMEKMRDKSDELIEENKQLMLRDMKQRSQLSILEHMETELSRKNVNIQKEIESLSEKCRLQMISLDNNETKRREIKRYDIKMESLVQELTQSTEKMGALWLDSESLEDEMLEARLAKDERVTVRRRVERTLVDTAEALKTIVTSSTAESDPCVRDTKGISFERENLLENLIRVLNGSDRSEMETNVPESDSPVDVGHSLHGKHRLGERYKLGDMGFIPRSSQNYVTNFKRMKHSKKSQENALLRFAQKSAGGNSSSTKKKISFMDQILCKYSMTERGETRTPRTSLTIEAITSIKNPK